MIATQANVLNIETLTSFVTKVELEIDAPLTYHAGQYLQVVMGENDKRPFSIASSPSISSTIELHIGATPDNPYAFEVLQKAQSERKLEVEIGLGEAYLRESDLPMILIAGGTGFSYTKSILHEVLASSSSRSVTLYWGTKTVEDQYEFDTLLALENEHDNFVFNPVVENPPADWTGKTGWVHKAVLNDADSFSGTQIYVAGRFEMAAAVRQDFASKGLETDSLFGDAFAFI